MVHRSSETSTNQSDVIIRSDDRLLNPVVDSDSIVSKIYMLNFVLWLFFLCFFLSPYWQKYCSFIPAVFFSLILTNIWQCCPSVLLTLSQYTYLDYSIIYLLPGIVHFISGVTHMENNLLFCSKLMFTNGKIVVCKYIIWFYSNLYFCQTHIWSSLLFIYLYQVLHIWKTIISFVLS